MGEVRSDRSAASGQGGAVLDRTFAAVVIDWDGLAAGTGAAQWRPVRRRVEDLTAAGVHVAVISAHEVDQVDRTLRARPSGPGGLLLGISCGQELYEVSNTGPRLLLRRGATAEETTALDRAAQSLVDDLSAMEVKACVEPMANRRAIALLAGPDAPELTVDGWLRECGFAERSELVRLATKVASQAGLANPRVRCGDRRVEIGLTDTPDSLLDVVDVLAEQGIGPGLMLVIGRDLGSAAAGESDSLAVLEARRATAVSVADGQAPDALIGVEGDLPRVVRLLDEQLRRIRTMRVPSVDVDPVWTVRETGRDSKMHRVNETLFTVGAGGFGTRGTVEEPSPLSTPMVLAAGVYQGAGAEQHPLPGPQWTELAITPEPEEDIRVLDLRTGVLYREEARGDGIPFRSLRIASLSLPGLVAMRAEGPVGRVHAVAPLQAPRGTVVTEGTVDGRQWMRVGAEGSGGIGAVGEQRVGRDGDHRTIERVAALVADARRHPSLPGAHALVDTASRRGFDRLLAEHRAAWAARWDVVDVRIPDDPDIERDIRFALFQLWCNTGRHDELAVGARGLSGPGYAGHVFWDSEVFVLPALVTIDPRAAQAMVTYRLRRLEAAKVRAKAGGHAGARFPWESAATGEDVTPAFGNIAGTPVPILTGLREEHITADVAWAAVHCGAWTGHPVTAASREWPLLRETARFWVSRCRRDGDGTAHIDEVIGPDEYHELVNDNAFTNAMARWNLRAAADIGESVPELAEECLEWRTLAAAIVDNYNPSTKLYEQFAGYYALEPLFVTDYAPPPVAADVMFPRDRIAASQSIKQADVLMIHHMIPEETAPGSLGPNLDFYGPRTTHGSSLSPAITAALLARAGRSDNALSMLRLALGVDLKDLNGTTAGGLHLATLGGIWQAVLAGFLGVRLSGQTLCLDPDLPTPWRSLEARFRCQKRCVRVRVSAEAVEVSTDGPLWVQLAGREARHVTGRVVLDR